MNPDKKRKLDISPTMAMILAVGPNEETIGLSCCGLLELCSLEDIKFLPQAYERLIRSNVNLQKIWDASATSENFWIQIGSDDLDSEIAKVIRYASTPRPAEELAEAYALHDVSPLPVAYGILDDSRIIFSVKHHFTDGISGLFWLDRLFGILAQIKSENSALNAYPIEFMPEKKQRMLYLSTILKTAAMAPVNSLVFSYLVMKSLRYKINRYFFSTQKSKDPARRFCLKTIRLDQDQTKAVFNACRTLRVKLTSYFVFQFSNYISKHSKNKTSALFLVTSYMKYHFTNNRFALLPYNMANHVIVDFNRIRLPWIDRMIRFQLWSNYGYFLLLIYRQMNRNYQDFLKNLREQSEKRQGSMDEGPATPTLCVTNLGPLQGEYIDRYCKNITFYLLTPMPSVFIYSFKGQISITWVANIDGNESFAELGSDFTNQFIPEAQQDSSRA